MAIKSNAAFFSDFPDLIDPVLTIKFRPEHNIKTTVYLAMSGTTIINIIICVEVHTAIDVHTICNNMQEVCRVYISHTETLLGSEIKKQ